MGFSSPKEMLLFLDSVKSISILTKSLMECHDETVLEKFVDLLEVSLKLLVENAKQEMCLVTSQIDASMLFLDKKISVLDDNFKNVLCQVTLRMDISDFSNAQKKVEDLHHVSPLSEKSENGESYPQEELLQIEHDYLWEEVVHSVHEMEYVYFKEGLDALIQDDNSAHDTEEDDQSFDLVDHF